MTETMTRRWDYYFLAAFALTAVASIALQNLLWVAVVLFLFAHWRKKEKIAWPRNLFIIATLLFLASFYLGCVLGVDPVKSFESVHKYLVFLGLLFVGAMALTLSDIRRLLNFFVAGACVCSIYGIYKYFILHEERIESFSGDKMVFGGLLMTALLIEIFLLRKDHRWNWPVAGALALTALALFLTQTRGAWVGCAAGLLLLLWRWNRKILMGLVVLLFGLYFVLPSHFQDRVKSVGHIWLGYDAQHHLNNAEPGRILIWVSGWRIIENHPWGVGQANIVDVYPRYKFEVMAEPTEPHLHDNYLQICAQNGWIGLAIYLFWILAYYHCAQKFRPVEGEANDLNWTLICVFSAVLVWGLTEYTFAQQFSTVFAFLLGLQVTLWKSSLNDSPVPKVPSAS